jgi:hypothetical protein
VVAVSVAAPRRIGVPWGSDVLWGKAERTLYDVSARLRFGRYLGKTDVPLTSRKCSDRPKADTAWVHAIPGPGNRFSAELPLSE